MKLARQYTHVVLYDGHCRICRSQVKTLLRLAAPGAVEARDFHQPGTLAAFPSLDHAACMEAMHLVGRNGRVARGAEAIVRALATRRLVAPFAYLYYLPGLRQVADLAYAWVARNRYRPFRPPGDCADGACDAHLKGPAQRPGA